MGAWSLSVDGAVIGDVRPSVAPLELNDGASLGADPHAIEVFVDGELLEVYFLGEVVTKRYASAKSQDVSLSASGADVTVHLDAWAMSSSVTGGPEE